MDCLEALKLLPEQFVDLTVTSGSYNIGKEYEKSLVLDEYLNWCEQWVAEVYRVTLDRGAFWLNLGYLSMRDRAKAIGISYLLWDKRSFYLIQEVVWNYGAPVAGSNFFSPRNEKFLWYVKNQYEYTFNLDEGLFWSCGGKRSVSGSLREAFGPVPREVLFLLSPKTQESSLAC